MPNVRYFKILEKTKYVLKLNCLNKYGMNIELIHMLMFSMFILNVPSYKTV